MQARGDSTACRDWIAAVISGREPAASIAGHPAGEAMAAADDEQVVGLLAEAIEARSPSAIPEGLHDALQARLRVESMRELAFLAQARQAINALAGARIPVLVLKGGALAYWLYADPVQRPRSDLDLLVADRDAALAAAERLAGEGYAPLAGVGVAETAEFEATLLRHSGAVSHAVDLHWRLVNHASLGRGFGFDELLSRSIAIPALHPAARGLGRVDALAHALLHRITNLPGGRQDRLGWLYDFHLLAGGCANDEWASFLRLCGDKRIASPCLDGLRACRAVFATAIPFDIEDGLARLSAGEGWKLGAVDQGGMDRAHFAALPWHAKPGWLRRKLFPSREFMRHRHDAQGGFGLLRAYAARWWIGIRRGLGGG